MNKTTTIHINDTSFEYDVRSLVRAFFSDHDISFTSSPDEADIRITLTPEEVYFDWDKIHKNTSIASMDRPEVKNAIKLLIYDALSAACHRELPWGTLTGVRPTKLVRGYIEKGIEYPKLERIMYEKYRTSSGRTSLAFDIANRELEIINDIEEASYSLYVGIPFCPSICLYCSFSSYPIQRYHDQINDYMACLYRELKETSKIFCGRKLKSIYIGGGTPSSVSAAALYKLMDQINTLFEPDEEIEWTVEAGRADSVTKEKLLVMRQFGNIRISINPQTFNQKTLDLIGRAHTTKDVEQAYYMAREAGFDNINMDIIVGLPGEEEPEVGCTLNKITELKPDNLTVHSLALKRASRLHEQWEAYSNMSFFNSELVMDRVHEAAASMGMKPYYLYRQKDIAGNLENIGFASSGKEGRYNILIMEDVQDIAACGSGAISKRVYNSPKACRSANVKGVEEYIRRIDEMTERKRNLFSYEHEADISK